MKMFNLSDNPLGELDFKIFSSFDNLEALVLSNTHIQNIPDECFVKNFKMKTLNMGNSSLEEFSSNLISTLYDLEILDLSNTRIQQIKDGDFANNSKMKVLNLKGIPMKLFNFNIFSTEMKSAIKLNCFLFVDIMLTQILV